MKYIVTILFSLSCIVGVNAQRDCMNKKDDSDIIVMPKEKLVEVIADAVKQKRENIAMQNARSLKLRAIEKKLEMLTQPEDVEVKSDKYDERFERLENQLRDLMIIMAGKNNNVPNNNVSSLPSTPNNVVDNSGLEKEISRLVAETERLKNKLNNKNATNMSQYNGELHEVFFAHDKSNLTNQAISKIDNVVSILKADEKLDVMVKGFASKVGNSVYNNNLSMKRTDEVKQALISKGIAPGRVLTTYHGEDLTNRSEVESRRVDIVILDSRK